MHSSGELMVHAAPWGLTTYINSFITISNRTRHVGRSNSNVTIQKQTVVHWVNKSELAKRQYFKYHIMKTPRRHVPFISYFKNNSRNGRKGKDPAHESTCWTPDQALQSTGDASPPQVTESFFFRNGDFSLFQTLLLGFDFFSMASTASFSFLRISRTRA